MAIKRKVKDSVFTKVFGEPEYAFKLYKVFHPEDTLSTEKDLKIITLENVFVNGEYNDLGLLMNNHLMLFIEAQSTWNDNMPIRILLYLAETYKRYMIDNKINLLKDSHVILPLPETYVIFTGEKNKKPKTVRLSEHFPNTEKYLIHRKNSLELTVKMIYNSNEGDIVYQYINFCKVLDEQRKLYPDDDDIAIRETIRICKNKKFLADYIKAHEAEVYKSMSDYLSNQKLLWKFFVEDERKTAIEKATHNFKIETAKKMLSDGLPLDAIVKYTSLPLDEVTKLQEEVTA